jgi:hypothetical protein
MVIPMVIQSTRVVPSGPDQADAASNLSRENPTSAVRFDWKHLPRNRKLAVRFLSAEAPRGVPDPCTGRADHPSFVMAAGSVHPFGRPRFLRKSDCRTDQPRFVTDNDIYVVVPDGYAPK